MCVCVCLHLQNAPVPSEPKHPRDHELQAPRPWDSSSSYSRHTVQCVLNPASNLLSWKSPQVCKWSSSLTLSQTIYSVSEALHSFATLSTQVPFCTGVIMAGYNLHFLPLMKHLFLSKSFLRAILWSERHFDPHCSNITGISYWDYSKVLERLWRVVARKSGIVTYTCHLGKLFKLTQPQLPLMKITHVENHEV